jgi:hypothetical protein
MCISRSPKCNLFSTTFNRSLDSSIFYEQHLISRWTGICNIWATDTVAADIYVMCHPPGVVLLFSPLFTWIIEDFHFLVLDSLNSIIEGETGWRPIKMFILPKLPIRISAAHLVIFQDHSQPWTQDFNTCPATFHRKRPIVVYFLGITR